MPPPNSWQLRRRKSSHVKYTDLASTVATRSPANQDIFESASRVKETVRFAMLQSGNPQLEFELLETVALIYGYVGSCIRCSNSDVDRRASSSSAAAAAAVAAAAACKRLNTVMTYTRCN